MTTSIQTSTDTLFEWSAAQIIERIAAGEISASEVTEAYLRRIEEVNPLINAIVVPMFEQARAHAAAVDAARSRGETLGPLAGLPITVKESFHVDGTPTTVGLTARASHRAPADAFHVARMRAAGAVVLGKTNVPLLVMSNDSQNPLYGRTKNPWNLDRSAGGSSGGEAAAIAAGCSPLGIGSDIGGSVRLPANVCGICALKPTSGRLTMAGHLDVVPGQEAILAQPGPLARYVGDLDLAFRFLCTPEQCTVDPTIPPLPPSSGSAILPTKLRVAMYTDNGVIAPAPSVARAVREAAAALRERGVEVEEWQPPDVPEAFELWLGLLMADGSTHLRQLCAGSKADAAQRLTFAAGRMPHGLLAAVVAPVFQLFGQSHTANAVRSIGRRSARDYWRLIKRRTQYRTRFLTALARGRFDAILCPVDALPAMIPGRSEDLIHALSYSATYNLLGMPAGAVAATRIRPEEESNRPASRDIVERAALETERGSAGLPVGVQVVAKHWREDVVLCLMELLEEHFSQLPDYPRVPTGLPNSN
jgi:Asp-tRNA(Asn)/Glu-tRNA(Gln) amidotransferase A subunit family amidase